MISVLTATYNRADLLPILYKSLILQIEQDFEWIVIDDGSTDNTKQVLSNIEEQNAVKMRWESIKNGGKHRAINKAVQMAKGDLCFIVDSDDKLEYNALMEINHHWDFVKNKYDFAGDRKSVV